MNRTTTINSGGKKRRSIQDFFEPKQKKAAITNASSSSPNHRNANSTTSKPIVNTEAEQWGRRLDATPQYLTEDGRSWYILAKRWYPTPSRDAFHREWKLHPVQRHSLQIFGRSVLENRWSQSWGVSYAYSGATNMARPISEESGTILASLMATINALLLQDDSNDTQNNNNSKKESTHIQQQEDNEEEQQRSHPYNGCLQNWYTQDDTIGLHADDEKSMRTQYPIFSLSWGGPRRFLFRPKVTKKKSSNNTSKKQQPALGVVDLLIEDGDLLLMGGTCQQTHKHEVPKVRKTKDPPSGNRINWTVRAFCT